MKFTTKTLLSATAMLAASASMSYAAGLDRSTFSAAILFQEGTYAEIAGGQTLPDIRLPTDRSDSIADNFKTIKLGFKMDVTDKIAIAIAYTNQPVGADISYNNVQSPIAAPGTPFLVSGAANGQRLDVLGKYKITNGFSVYGGVRYQYLNGEVDLTGLGAINTKVHGESEYGFIGGVAYEIPKIKLRVSLSYEQKIDYSLNTTLKAPFTIPGPVTLPAGTNIGKTTAATPEAWTLEFQSGVAANTLVFGSIRYADWKNAQIVLPIAGQITTFTNEIRYDLGVAYRFSDKFVGFTSLGYEPATELKQGLFGPIDGQFDMTFGGQASMGNGVKLAASMTYSRRGDSINSTIPGLTFNDSNVYTFGMKLSKNF